MTGYHGDPAWDRIMRTSEEDDAFNELQARLDRIDDYAPTTCPPSPSGVQRPAMPGCSSPTAPGRPVTGRPGASGGLLDDEAAAALERPAA